jgi:AcrR family transcriptional regulator
VTVIDDRPLRTDAQRNRDRLIGAAVRAFDRDDDASLALIAKEAGVGIGTLYRHFPTRAALFEAAYRLELVRLCASATELLHTMPADVALRCWMDLVIDYLATKRGMAEALLAVISSGGDPFASSRDGLLLAVDTMLDAGAATSGLRDDIDPADVLTSLSGVSLAAGTPEQRDQAGRLLDLLIDGLRYRPVELTGAAAHYTGRRRRASDWHGIERDSPSHAPSQAAAESVGFEPTMSLRS